ncbi:hypothetical protein Bbelb_128040 [Branchiostoma belcheri]|nr:hypothetical protein Bbelb_128040 [Branchiostoma belcheri]
MTFPFLRNPIPVGTVSVVQTSGPRLAWGEDCGASLSPGTQADTDKSCADSSKPIARLAKVVTRDHVYGSTPTFTASPTGTYTADIAGWYGNVCDEPTSGH